MEIKVYVTNLALYNEGELVGEWLTLPATEEEIEECLERIGIDDEHEEYFLTDWESETPGLCEGLHVGEYSILENLSEALEDVPDDIDEDALAAALDDFSTWAEALEVVSKGNYNVYYGCETMEDVAREYCEECGVLNGIPENLRYYFDFEAYGRDMALEGNFVYYDGNYYEFY